MIDDTSQEFINRHIGPSKNDQKSMQKNDRKMVIGSGKPCGTLGHPKTYNIKEVELTL